MPTTHSARAARHSLRYAPCILAVAGAFTAAIGTFVFYNLYCLFLLLWIAAFGCACGSYLDLRNIRRGKAWGIFTIGRVLMGILAVGLVLALTAKFFCFA